MDVVTKPGNEPGIEEGWSPRLVLSLVSIILLLEVLAVSYLMVATAVPRIAAHYQTTQAAWLFTAFLLFGAVTAPLIGKLADMFGKRLALLGCAVVSLVGSFLCAIAPNFTVLIAGRTLAGALVPCVFLSYSLIRDVFPPKTVALAVSLTMSGMGLVAIPAPFLTGWLIEDFGFRSIFWFFTIVLGVITPLIAVTTAESPVRLRSRLDLIGSTLLGVGIGCVLVAVSFGPQWGWADGSTLIYFVVGGVALVAWLVSAGVVREPLLDLSVLRVRPVALTVICAGVAYGCSTLFTLLLPMLAMTPDQLGLGYGFGVSEKEFAIFQVPLGGMVAVGGALTGVLVGRKVAPRLMMIIGMAITAVGFTLTANMHDQRAQLMLFTAVAGFGMGAAYASIPNLLIEAVPPQLQASTASLAGVMQALGGAAFPVIVFAVMNNSHIAPIPLEMTQGHIFYTEDGFQTAFMIGAATAVVALVVALLMPRRVQQVQAPPAVRVVVD